MPWNNGSLLIWNCRVLIPLGLLFPALAVPAVWGCVLRPSSSSNSKTHELLVEKGPRRGGYFKNAHSGQDIEQIASNPYPFLVPDTQLLLLSV